MTLTQSTGPGMHSPMDARTARRTLRAERAHLLHWRRLVRGRLDLAVAAFAPPPGLGEMGWDLVPEAQLSLPVQRELARAVALSSTADPIALMEHLRSLDRQLAAYGEALDAALERATDDDVEDLAGVGRPARGDLPAPR